MSDENSVRHLSDEELLAAGRSASGAELAFILDEAERRWYCAPCKTGRFHNCPRTPCCALTPMHTLAVLPPPTPRTEEPQTGR